VDQSTSGLKLVKCYWFSTKQACREGRCTVHDNRFLKISLLSYVGSFVSEQCYRWGSSANTELFTIQKKLINGRCKEKLLVGNYLTNYIYIYITL